MIIVRKKILLVYSLIVVLYFAVTLTRGNLSSFSESALTAKIESLPQTIVESLSEKSDSKSDSKSKAAHRIEDPLAPAEAKMPIK